MPALAEKTVCCLENSYQKLRMRETDKYKTDKDETDKGKTDKGKTDE